MQKSGEDIRAEQLYAIRVMSGGCKNDFAETSAKHTHGDDSFLYGI